MMFYIYSGVIPIAIIILVLWFNRPLSFQRITRAATISILPLLIYTLLIYYVEGEDIIDVGWVSYTLTFFFIPYLIGVLILNGVAWRKRKKAKA